ncbi:HIT family protein [Paenibacillus ginsengarvi]|uniref:HIT family protein n=1 Tax=Paenibacillus ginsengarvi TaxID=400777 RepID=A0A3B0AX81_9BACL|nr:HIT family protein [Paenibacillus ginsengarvi]RKN64901.1 HIT family protein [Paenibacillus ginsengarvi]
MNECPFCHIKEADGQRIVFENEYCLFLQKESEQLVLEGCGLIVPKAHKENVFELSREEWNATYDVLQQVKELLDNGHSPDGYTLGWNVGRVSNQEISHAHFHVIPRFRDEPYAGKGLRYWIKQKENMRPGRKE